MDEPLEYVIQRLRMEFENRRRYHGDGFYGLFELKIDIQNGLIIHGSLNGIKFKIPTELLDRIKGKS